MRSITPQRSKGVAAAAAIFLLVAGGVRFPCDNVRLLMVLLFSGAVVGLTAVVMWNVNRWLAYFLAAAFWSMLFPVYSRESHLAFQMVFYGAVWYGFVVLFVKDINVRFLLDAMCLIALANVAMLTMQTLGHDPLYIPRPQWAGTTPHVGLMTNPNEVSALLAFCAPAFLRGRYKWGLVAVIVGLVMAQSTGGAFALAAGLMFYEFANGRIWKPLVACGIAVVLFSLAVDMPHLGGREATWKFALSIYPQHWLFGAGLGHWKIVFSKIESARACYWMQAHNEFIQGLFEMGIPFAVIVAGYLISCARRFRKAALIPATAGVVIVVNSLVNFPFHIATTALLAMTWLAIYEVKLKEVA